MGLRGYWGLVLFLMGADSAFGIGFRAEIGVPPEIEVPSRAGYSRAPAVFETFKLSIPKWEDVAGGKGVVTFEGASSFSAEGLPQLPVVVKKFALPVGNAPQVSLSDLVLERSEAVPQIEKVAEAYVWGPQELKFVTPARGRYYPGKFVESKVVGSEVWVSLYPVQFDRQTGELVSLRSASLALDFVTQRSVFLVPSQKGPEALIVTSRAMKDAAERLKQFHSDLYGVDSGILYVESLTNEPMVAESELPDGYKDKDTVVGITLYDAVKKTGYDYDLSRRLVHYMNRQMADGKALRYVTILGDATVVPPSYYFSIRSLFGPSFGVTDACYGATDACLAPKLAVGRLPFNGKSDLDNYLSKLETWLDSGDEPGPELALYGGKAFRGYQYVGELGALRLLSAETVNWNGVEKHFRTNGSFSKAQSLRLVGGDQRAKVAYYLDHGRGNEWYVEKEFVSAKEALDAQPAPGRINPFLVSISCTNGAYDRSLVDGSQFGPPSSGDESVGMAMLKSKAGVVGYLGAARPALGNPLYKLDPSGNLTLTGSTYGLQLMDTFLQRYHDQIEGRVGDLMLYSLQRYVAAAGNDMSDESHIWTVLNLVLLGDPLAPMLPRRHFGNSVEATKLATPFPRPAVGSAMPFFDLGTDALQKFSLVFAGGQDVKATLLKVDRMRDKETLVAEHQVSAAQSTWNWEVPAADATGVYLLKLENKKGVPLERQAWFGVSTPLF